MKVSTQQRQIAELAQRHAGEGLNTLHTYLDVDWLREAYYRVRKDGAPGIDGETWTSYGMKLEANLGDLWERAKSGRYQAPPVKRVHIPKGNGKETRPIGIPTLEDKVFSLPEIDILQRNLSDSGRAMNAFQRGAGVVVSESRCNAHRGRLGDPLEERQPVVSHDGLKKQNRGFHHFLQELLM